MQGPELAEECAPPQHVVGGYAKHRSRSPDSCALASHHNILPLDVGSDTTRSYSDACAYTGCSRAQSSSVPQRLIQWTHLMRHEAGERNLKEAAF